MSANEKQISGVLCLFCGMVTQVPDSVGDKVHSKGGVHTSLVRCEQCGKEARYLPNEVIDIHHAENMEALKARAAGLS
jgi:Zn ribbon nucleic-acid-binding protein